MDKRLEKYYNRDLDIWGLPQHYKGVDFYPILLRDVKMQDIFYKIFQYPKNNIPDKQVIRWSYLKYLIMIDANRQSSENLDGLTELLEYSTRSECDCKVANPEKNIDEWVLNITIGNKAFSEYEFDIIRGILLEQNGLSIEYIEEYDPDLEEKLKYSNWDMRDVTIEDQIFAFITINNLSINNIKDYTIYQFKKHFTRSVLLFDYQIYRPLEASGQITSKSGEKIVRHYMEHLGEKGRYSSIMISQEKLYNVLPGLQDEHGNIPNPMPENRK